MGKTSFPPYLAKYSPTMNEIIVMGFTKTTLHACLFEICTAGVTYVALIQNVVMEYWDSLVIYLLNLNVCLCNIPYRSDNIIYCAYGMFFTKSEKIIQMFI